MDKEKKSTITKKNTKKYKLLGNIQKRDGMIVPFDENRITHAVLKAMSMSSEGSEEDAVKVMEDVVEALLVLKKEGGKDYIPQVETIQDLIENKLILWYYKTGSEEIKNE